MALIERLMHDSSEPESRWLAVHTFFAAASEVERGALTSAQVKTYLAMTAPDIADWDALVALVTGAAAARLAVIQRIHSVFILAEVRAPGYDTPSAVRTKLGI
jgi:hypothetical protein